MGTADTFRRSLVESSQAIEEMMQMVKDMQEAMKRHEELGLNPDERFGRGIDESRDESRGP